MLPLRDLNPRRSTPWVTYLLIFANVLVFLFQTSLDESALRTLLEQRGVVPSALTQGLPGSWTAVLSSMFLHGGWLHLLGNMWFLHVFGDNLEDALGHWRYLIFYLACGAAAALGQTWADPQSTVPMVGASGAIAGVLGGYVLASPRARVVTVVPIFIFLQVIELPAFVFIFVWFGWQLLMGWLSFGRIEALSGGVAFFAHIGGFLAGLLLLPLFAKRR